MKGLIVNSADFDTINSRVHDWCNINITGYKANKWADKIIHPVDGRIAIPADDRVIGAFTDQEKKV